MVGEKNSGVSQLCLLPSVGRGMDGCCVLNSCKKWQCFLKLGLNSSST